MSSFLLDSYTSDSTGRSSRASPASGSRPGSNITVEETESDDDDVRVIRNKKQNKARKFIQSSSEEEDELDERAFSPRTRMSITGVRPEDVSDESTDIDYEDESEDDSVSGQEEGAAAASSSRIEDKAPRYTQQFDSINQSLHSTLVTLEEIDATDTSSSDVLILSNKDETIEIFSSGDESKEHNKENISLPYSPRTSAGAPLPKPAKTLSQPIISKAFKLEPPSKPTNVDEKPVTQQHMQAEKRRLSGMQTELLDAEKLYDKVAHKLPDGGQQIKKRIDGLRRSIETQRKYVEGLKINDSIEEVPVIKIKPQPLPPPPPQADGAPDWDDLSEAVNKIQPSHTGRQGMATFNTQKALTMDRLQDLHGSLKNCPGEDVLADDPAGLRVTLMAHQKHALAWINWREQQKPSGGILADDMGLGKTLTMLSSILAYKNRQESGNDGSDKSDSDNDERKSSNVAWKSKGRKDAYNGGTLVVCPASLLRQWEGEVDSKISRNRLTVCVHHGNNRETRAKHLRTYDIVVTTYQIVAREHKTSGALYGIKWKRIILDEAHVVRNHKSQSSVAVSELLGKYRWALTGTPIQNKELDVYALLKFLRCSPFDDLATWKKWIDNKSAGGQQRLNMLMKSLMLRRTKAQLQIDGKLNSLPSKATELIEITLETDEMNVYQKIMTYSRTLFAQFLFQRAEKDTDANFINDAMKPTYNQVKDPNGAYYKMHEKFSRMYHSNKQVKSHEILTLLLRLRQICCHPGLIDAMLDGDESSHMNDDDSDSESPEIDLLEQLNKLAITDGDSPPNADNVGEADEQRISKASKNVLKRSNPVFNLGRASTKMQKVMDILKLKLRNNKDKAIIVSQWVSVLDLLGNHLTEAHWATLALNGSVPVKSRQNIVNEFNDPNSNKRILLLSLTAGGVGLNLIGANHLLLIDLHWNPQLEAQAQDRIYRVGQKKDVFIYKFMCVDTVEQRIKALQDKKLELANGVLTGAKVSTKLTIDDLKGLFGM